MNGVTTRVATGLALAIPILLAVLYLSPTGFAVLTSVLMLAAFWEWTRLSGLPGRPVRALAVAGLGLLFAGLAVLPHRQLLIVAWIACGFWLLATL